MIVMRKTISIACNCHEMFFIPCSTIHRVEHVDKMMATYYFNSECILIIVIGINHHDMPRWSQSQMATK